MIQKLGYNFGIATEAIFHNKLRSILTSLGIIFGVASVIAMLAIGRGAQEEILEQMKLLGANNIIIKPLVKQEEGKVKDDEDEKKKEKDKFSPGLTMADADAIRRLIPGVESVSPEIIVEITALREGIKRTTKLVGVEPSYFATSDFERLDGSFFLPTHLSDAAPVCVIGYGVKNRFFSKEDPVGKMIKCGSLWFSVVGVLKERRISKESMKHLGIRDYNMDIYTPATTLLLRYKNRLVITKKDIMRAARSNGDEEEVTAKSKNYHQVDRMVTRVSETKNSAATAEILSRLLTRRHNGVVDFEITVPEQLLQQEQRTRSIFNIVLGAIASISLIVGGIGIMNIMLASVMERIKEIGTRLAIGATKRDIILQFLSEAIAISISGGLIGIALGVGLSYGIEKATDIRTIVSPLSVLMSFAVSISIGLVFGIVPARRAALQDPIVSLRYE